MQGNWKDNGPTVSKRTQAKYDKAKTATTKASGAHSEEVAAIYARMQTPGGEAILTRKERKVIMKIKGKRKFGW
jgi:hypothetical protein